MLELVKCNRRKLEKAVLRTLISPTASSVELDEAVARLKPTGKLKLATNEKPTKRK